MLQDRENNITSATLSSLSCSSTSEMPSSSSATENNMATTTNSSPPSIVSTELLVTLANNADILVSDPGLTALFHFGTNGLQIGTLFVAFVSSTGQLSFAPEVQPPALPLNLHVNENGSALIPGTEAVCKENGDLIVLTNQAETTDGCQAVVPAVKER